MQWDFSIRFTFSGMNANFYRIQFTCWQKNMENIKRTKWQKNRMRRYGRHVDIRVALNVNLACKCIIPLPDTRTTVFVLRYELI